MGARSVSFPISRRSCRTGAPKAMMRRRRGSCPTRPRRTWYHARTQICVHIYMCRRRRKRGGQTQCYICSVSVQEALVRSKILKISNYASNFQQDEIPEMEHVNLVEFLPQAKVSIAQHESNRRNCPGEGGEGGGGKEMDKIKICHCCCCCCCHDDKTGRLANRPGLAHSPL